ncbi:MAG TPA: hypothetical protein VKV28_15400 [Candidatus Binataceae bacterium]|nr:hypothetical protein [Candidatus Binataceae bacterium]
MVISKTPCRISLAGGGSDMAAFYEQEQGAVVTATIDKYIYVLVNAKFDRRIRIGYSRTEEVERIDQIEHPIARESLRLFGQPHGIEIVSVADIPSRGSGLGSSSAYTVGLLNSLFAFSAQRAGPAQLAGLAAKVEIELCAQPIGLQDQYAVAYGGLNFMAFERQGKVTVSPIVCAARVLDRLEERLGLYYTGITRTAGSILGSQGRAMRQGRRAFAIMGRMVELSHRMRLELEAGNVESVGEMLHEGWMLKRSLTAGITNPEIDEYYARARAAGAVGGKLLGAGGGGFLLFFASAAAHARIGAALKLRRVPFAFEGEGSKIVFYQPQAVEIEGAARRAAF